ncbi:hypothetical protein PHLGIDRAFT_119658 [Phlebiopsis gigantea 11061_1 CR5-6]|uniref:SHSP domain-containing protein n=1 Tax=Phlebiopsis gigantea (strain 11061_1 CR5-6) TaxID=745531 RepID=A0A0C3RVZ5_PHLG1|nr:hypothetical protein PHLGIDRAFT_119658 [Phlebiopsis gigantea 11061_1 CR5-6]
MSQPPTASRLASKKTVAGRGAHARLAVDPRLVLSRIYHLQRLRRERALLLSPAAHQYLPRMDLYDDATSPIIAAMLELPGVDRRNLSLRVQGSKLVVHGERAAPLAARLPQDSAAQRDAHLSPNYKIRELKFGSFHREIDVPAGIETSDITAEMTDGMLYISWPRNLSNTLSPQRHSS